MTAHLNQELLTKRMMRGACMGAVAEEIPTMARCKGKLENGTRCAIIAAPGKALCTKCEASGAELYDKVAKIPTPVLPAVERTEKKRGRPAKKGQLSEAEQELQAATELCTSCAGEDCCNGPGHGVNECAAYSPKEQNIPENIPDGLTISSMTIESDGVTDTLRMGLPSSVHAKMAASVNKNEPAQSTNHTEEPLEMVDWVRDDERTLALLEQVGIRCSSVQALTPFSDEDLKAEEDWALAVYQQAGDFQDDGVPSMPFFLKPAFTDLQISPTTDDLIKEAATLCTELSSPLAAVLTELPPPVPPLPDTAVVIEFPEDMYETLADKGVGTATIIELLHVLFISEEYRLVRNAAA